MVTLQYKRVYDHPSEYDGFRILVDRMWPRGLSKQEAHLDLRYQDLAPSTDLRKWYHIDREGRWNDFEQQYYEELEHNPKLDEFLEICREHKFVTLLVGLKELDHSNGKVMVDFLRHKL